MLKSLAQRYYFFFEKSLLRAIICGKTRKIMPINPIYATKSLFYQNKSVNLS